MRLRLALAGFAFLLTHSVFAAEVTDLAGRTVTVPDKVERIVLGEGRYFPALSILDRDDPVRRVVGMMGEYEKLDPASYGRLKAKFPKIDDVPRIGRAAADSFSLEKVIALKPQVAFLGIEGHGPGSSATEIIKSLEAAGVTIVFIDFRSDPLANTPKSMELLGKVLGKEKEATDFLAVWHAEMNKVTSVLAEKKPAPVRTFVESRVGLSPGCCETMVRGMIADFVTKAGGVNIAGDIVPGHAGTVSLEFLLTNPPEVYIGTAIGAAATKDSSPERLALGSDVSAEVARETLQRSLRRTGIADLDAVKNGRAFAVWHHFYNSPLNVAAVQAIAKWLHPDLFKHLDPEGLLRDLHHKFQPYELEGVYWTSSG
jgi:iron complex transport system substrate-binding protein